MLLTQRRKEKLVFVVICDVVVYQVEIASHSALAMTVGAKQRITFVYSY
jgi:hypothetical protein